ncbi:MAG TPA: hypothetical protein VKE92_14920 [Anaerolineales bacterium]|nr:hypothetical protein [Anaerolineales bacterium]
MIIVDDDDPTLSTYYTVLNGVGQVTVVPAGNRGMVAALQHGLDIHSEHLGFAVGFFGDDHRPRTVGWDTRYLETLRELGTGFVYGNDLFQGQAIATQVAMTSDIPKALGYICPRGFDHLCVDVVWNDWGTAIDKIVYLDDVIVEHVHYLAGKSAFDKGYAVVNSPQMAHHDNTYYQTYHSDGSFEADVEKLNALLPRKRGRKPNPAKSGDDG